jgi:hypothetical protein
LRVTSRGLGDVYKRQHRAVAELFNLVDHEQS